MNSKERWERFFAGEPLDRLPIWLLFPYHPVSYYTDVYNNPYYRRIIRKVEENNIDILDRRNFETGFCFSRADEIVVNEKRSEKTEDGFTVEEVVQWGDIRLTSRSVQRGSSLMRTKSFVSEIDDLNKILSMPYTPPQPNLDQFFKEKEELGQRGWMMADAGDAIATLYHLCDPASLAIWSITEKESLVHFLDQIHRRVLEFYEYLLDNGVGPVFFAVGGEFMGPPLIAPSNFWDLAGRYLQDLVALVRSYGCKFMLHYHGNIKRVLPFIKEIEPDAVHTIEAPPVGDCTIKEARDVLGSEIALVGNIQYDDLVRKDEREIRILVKEAIEQGRGGRFILSPTAGPYEDVLSEQTINNYLALISAGVTMGK